MSLHIELGTSGGAEDANFTGSAGTPTVRGLGPDGAGAHAPSERASLNSLMQRVALLAAYLTCPTTTSGWYPAT